MHIIKKVWTVKKYIAYIVVLAVLFSVLPQTPKIKNSAIAAENSKAITADDFLKASGKVLKANNGQGDEVILRGVNAGGWLVQEPWMCPTQTTDNVKCQVQIVNTLISRFGEEKANELLKTYEDNYWTESDFDNCAYMGMNVIRLPFTYLNILDSNNQIKADAFTKIDWFVQECGKRGMYVILDLHGAPGSQNAEVHSGDVSGIGLFEGGNAAQNQQLAVKVWKAVAEHYKGNPIVAGYDLLNEPYSSSDYHYTSKVVWDFYDLAYDSIREIDSDHVIIMEATWEPNQLPYPSEYGWENIMYEYHCYNYGSQTNAEDQLASVNAKLNRIDKRNYDVPSYIGETSFFSNMDSWRACLQRMNDYGISWTLWSYKVTGNNNSWGIFNQDVNKANIENDSYEQIYQKWSASGKCFKNTEVYNIVMEYLQKRGADNPGGIGRYEAELADYICEGGVIKTMTGNFGKFSNEGYVEALNDNYIDNMEAVKYMEFNLKVSTAGTYKVMVGYATSTDTKFAVKANDEPWVYRAVASTGYWDLVWRAPVYVKLNQGDNKLKITGAIEDNTENTWIIIDYFDLELSQEDTTPETSVEVTTPAQIETTIQEQAVTTTAVQPVTTTSKNEDTTTVRPVESTTFEMAETTTVYIQETTPDVTNVIETTVRQSESVTDKNGNANSNLKVKKPKKVKIKSIKNIKNKKAIIKIKKIKKVSGYQIKYSLKRKFKNKKIRNTTKLKFTVKKLKKRTYYFKVRAYKIYDGKKIYGVWSKVKRVKIKK